MDPLLLSYLGDDKTSDRDLPEGLTLEDVAELFRWMVTLRAFDERAVALQRQGRLGTYPMCWGEEATQCGPLFACAEEDWVFPSYRQQAVGILRGVPPATIFRYRRGIGGRDGFWSPRAHRVAPITISIATQVPHAVGFAWAARIARSSACAVVWHGEGATSEGDWHEGMNLASVVKAGVVIFCTNNQWAISTPFSRQTATSTIAEKASIYGMPSIRVDGFDVVACWKATRDALERARDGGGPTLIEAVTYRIGPHATADDPSRYRDQTEAEFWRAKEPIGRAGAYLERHGALDRYERAAVEAGAKTTIDEAVREMESTPIPGHDVLFDTTFSSGMPWPLRDGLAELDALP
ncbi:MAG TPA: thiamine pyrophosphate-dependent enzyme [Actinomycetota bacterium]|nr:thiamine pyrophosphate-dependent enzyme [Actinomycetota bacterium]